MTETIEHRRRRALFRAHHRGTKELDWLVGKFADAHLDSMGEAELTAFEAFLSVPDPDLQNWLMGGADVDRVELRQLVSAMRVHHGLA